MKGIMTEEERIRVMIITTLSGLDATYEHYKGQFPPGSQGDSICSKIPAVRHLVETYLVELNK